MTCFGQSQIRVASSEFCAAPFFLAHGRPATIDMLIDHAAYIADLVGPQHVGLGLDFADEDEDDFVYFGYEERYIPRPPWIWPTGITGHAQAGNIAPALKARGFRSTRDRRYPGREFSTLFWRNLGRLGTNAPLVCAGARDFEKGCLQKRRERVEWTMIVTRNRSCCSGSLARDHSPRVRI